MILKKIPSPHRVYPHEYEIQKSFTCIYIVCYYRRYIFFKKKASVYYPGALPIHYALLLPFAGRPSKKVAILACFTANYYITI